MTLFGLRADVVRVFRHDLFVSHRGGLEDVLAEQISDHHQESEKRQRSNTNSQYAYNHEVRHSEKSKATCT